MGVDWEYEIEGYDLGDDGWYLPDFYLPDLGVFVEVKPTKKGKNKCGAFRDKVSPIILCYGTPGKFNQILYCFESNDSNGGSVEHEGMFTKFPTYNDILNWKDGDIIQLPGGEVVMTYPTRFVTFETISKHDYLSVGIVDDLNTDMVIRMYDMFAYQDIIGNENTKLSEAIRIYKKGVEEERAVINARSARFEHGENRADY